MVSLLHRATIIICVTRISAFLVIILYAQYAEITVSRLNSISKKVWKPGSSGPPETAYRKCFPALLIYADATDLIVMPKLTRIKPRHRRESPKRRTTGCRRR